ncbi:unnamed protein product [Orchesella dallaii]|uniref:CRAL-TRIO domain-containing protein n=1 Tax=Orchesella dallaii TaxID=48710 RepID=A0ABP1S6U9_9HEXA
MLILKEEISSLQKFKEVVSDLNQDDGVLIRFLRARDYDIENAEQILRYAVQWRKEMDLDNYSLKKWSFPPHFYTDVKYGFFGRDYEGAPISWLFVGTWAMKQMLENEDLEQIQRYFYSFMEIGLQHTIDCGSPGNVVMDIDGLSYTQATHLPTLKFLYSSFQKYEQCYPETLKSILIINAPWIFSFGFNFVKRAIAPRTQEKIQIFRYKEEWHAEFLKRFPRESILPELQPPTD